jgi:hypothetical protein
MMAWWWRKKHVVTLNKINIHNTSCVLTCESLLLICKPGRGSFVGTFERQMKGGSENRASLIKLIWAPFLDPDCYEPESGSNLELLWRTRTPMNWHQSMGHKGPVVRPRCTGTERARTQTLFYFILFLVLATIHCDIDKESNCILNKKLVPTLLAHKNGCTQNM